MTQLDIFDVLVNMAKVELASNPLEVTLEVGDLVKIKKPSDFTELDVETLNHLEKYGGLKGKVIEIHQAKAVSYLVETSKGNFYFHDAELSFIG